MTRPLLAQGWRAVLAVAISVIATFLIHLFPAANLLLIPSIIWFPVPTAVVAIVAISLAEKEARRNRTPEKSPARVGWIAVLSTCALILLGLGLTGYSGVVAGSVRLQGDEESGSYFYDSTYSLLMPFVEGIVEDLVCAVGYSLAGPQYSAP